jgi:cytidine deaminase
MSSGTPAITAEQIRELHAKAKAARKYGWRPYSEFPVAAAVLTKSGNTYGGAGNVECANYTLTKHAEETAIIQALAAGELKCSGQAFIRAVYLPATDEPKRVMPCGGCRQFIFEFSDDETVVIAEVPGEDPEIHLLTDLLTEPFGPADTGKTAKDSPD